MHRKCLRSCRSHGRDERIAPIVILDDPVQEDWDEHVVSHCGLALVEAGFKIGADKVPRLVKNIAVEVAECAGCFPIKVGIAVSL